MQYEPPRATKKYSQTLEFSINRLHHGMMQWVPDFLKPGETIAVAPLAAASLSIVPGLGSFYLNQKLWWPLFQFGAWFFLLATYFFTFWTGTGYMTAMVLFSFHQYLMYNSYLQGLRLNQIPVPRFWAGLRTSLLMAAILGLFYYGAFGVLADHLFYAQRGLGNVVQEGDRYFVTGSDKYSTGQLVLFSRDYQYRHGSSGVAFLMERILAQGGDQVTVTDGKITVNGQPLADNAGPLEAVTLPNTSFTVPKDCYFMVFPISTNYRFDPNWYFISKDSIKGSLAFKYYPRMEAMP